MSGRDIGVLRPRKSPGVARDVGCLCVLLMCIAAICLPFSADAEPCIAPVKPEAQYLKDAGYSREEVHAAFRVYFREVEAFLNCWNDVTARVHAEARVAAAELGRVLRDSPAAEENRHALEGVEGFIASDRPLIETGELVLSIGK